MHRIEVCLKSHLPDARGEGLVKDIHDLGITTVTDVRVVDIYWLDADLASGELDLIGHYLLADLVTHEYQCFALSTDIKVSLKRRSPFKSSLPNAVEVAYNAGVTDPIEDSVLKAIRDLGLKNVRAAKTSRRYLIAGRLDQRELDVICSRLLVNPIIQHVVERAQFDFSENPQYRFKREEVDITASDKKGLARRFGFSADEFQAIVDYFRQQGRNPVDVELETLAQTWSEHCVHKTFKGKIRYHGKTIDNLLKSTVMKATRELNKPWCLSVFMDNAGVIDFDGRWALCFKVETHNHPSALEPYGGAATGIGGVIRDPLGTGLGAKP
ncbi:MAG: phosphoribosylformylglycinamidine synthase, partial [Dehalococcoidales bacterium]|nr:phosphoribosylformylglycinamidine synthase [Dehalococcoidales bacterium]